MTIKRSTLFVAALIGLTMWLAAITLVLFLHDFAAGSNNNSNDAPVHDYVPEQGTNPDGTQYEQAPDLEGECVTYDGDYTNDECPE